MSILFISIILVKFIFSFFVIEELISLQHFLRYCSILVCVSEWGIHRLLVRDGSWTNDLLARRQWSFNVMFKEVLSTLNICQLHVDSNPQRWAVTWSTQTWPADGRTMSCNVFFFFLFSTDCNDFMFLSGWKHFQILISAASPHSSLLGLHPGGEIGSSAALTVDFRLCDWALMWDGNWRMEAWLRRKLWICFWIRLCSQHIFPLMKQKYSRNHREHAEEGVSRAPASAPIDIFLFLKGDCKSFFFFFKWKWHTASKGALELCEIFHA